MSHPADVEAMMKLIKECVMWHFKLVKVAATGVCVCVCVCMCVYICVCVFVSYDIGRCA